MKTVKKEVSRLLGHVENTFGRKIATAGDCELLRLQLNNQLSQSSLRRVFGLVEHEGEPRADTLDILARYIGYSDFQAYKEWLFSKEGVSIRITDFLDGWKFCRMVGNSLRSDPDTQEILYPLLAQTEGYFNNWMDIDYLCLNHHKGLELFSELNCTEDSQCLSHGWLALAKFLNPELGSPDIHIYALEPLVLSWIDLPSHIKVHPYLAGRALAPVYIYWQKQEMSVQRQKAVEFMFSYCMPGHFTIEDKWSDHPAFAHSLAEYLLVCGEYKLVDDLLACALQAYPHFCYRQPETQLTHNLPYIYKAFTLIQNGDNDNARKWLERATAPTEDWPSPKWDYNLWYRYWYGSAQALLNDDGALKQQMANIAHSQAWLALCRHFG